MARWTASMNCLKVRSGWLLDDALSGSYQPPGQHDGERLLALAALTVGNGICGASETIPERFRSSSPRAAGGNRLAVLRGGAELPVPRDLDRLLFKSRIAGFLDTQVLSGALSADVQRNCYSS